jgi:hypothetical protein
VGISDSPDLGPSIAFPVLTPRRSIMAGTSSNINAHMAHRVTFEDPDTVCISLVGPLVKAEAEVILARIRELGNEHGPMFWLIDVSEFEPSSERVRDVFIKGGSERYPIFAGVMCGAPFTLRVAMMMVLTAGARILPKTFSFPFEFTATEAQAREWIASKRGTMMSQGDARELYATS